MSYSERRRDRNKRRRSRSRSISPISSKSSRKREICEYKHELERFLEEHASIRNTNDFWKFYEKYKSLQTIQKSDADTAKLVSLDFMENISLYYEKLPVLDKKGKRFALSLSDFKDLLLVIKVYQDFQQKRNFAKIKKMKQFSSDLPIAQYKTEIIEKLKENRVLLIAGDTGCGKSTQVPQYILEAGYNKIVCTQPRRIACVSLAKRVAHECLSDYKNTVGYQIRFEKTKRADTKIIFMTEGLLLRQASEKEVIETYDVIILDEVHERNLDSDFLIGIMKCLLHQRNDFKLILMSATINIELFSNYFANENIQVIQVPGRLYPIDIQYRPIIKDPFARKRDKLDCSPYLQILQLIDEKYQPNQKGDALIFLNGFSEISTLADAVTQYSEAKKNWIVLPLHSSLSLEEQDKVFNYPPEGVRKCIISTNIAETSVTIDGIRFVIDSGKVNRMSYNADGGISKLSECNISMDSAKQRAGRAGRTGPGICFRLYSEEDLNTFEPFTPAEIHQVPLDSLLLHMISLGLNDITNFPFLEKPDNKSIEENLEKLKFIGALELDNDSLALTQLGDSLSKLPVDLTIGKMLIMSTVFGNVNSVLALASLLSIQSPLTQQSQRNIDARELRKPMESSHGDPITLLNYYKEWLSVKQSFTPTQSHSKKESGMSSKVWARKRCLEEQRFYEATKLIEQFRDILQDAELLPKISEKDLNSGERSIRLGELKQLKSMRYQLKNDERMKSRKQLKYDSSVDDDNEKVDIRDVEFRISNDFRRLEKLLNEASADSYKDLMMLKLILMSGLYPKIAVEDEFNSSKTVLERLYHTKHKNYIFLRPDSYFATNSEVLELHNDDIEIPPAGYFSKRPISKKHQILVYQTILETKKVYLVNTMRMPALQSLLLFGKLIATNETFTKFVVDEFLSFDVPHFGQGKTLLLKAIDLRKSWNDKLESRLKSSTEVKLDHKELFYFMEDLVNYMATDEAAAIQMLIETCSETDSDKMVPGRQWALQEVRSLVCSYLHQAFIADTMLCKLVHFQTYPSELIEIVVKGVPSMHICLDFLQELMQQPSLNKQIFGIQLLSHISLQYALPKSLNLCVLALNLLYALLGGLSSAQRVKLFRPVLPALVRLSEAFPPLTEDIINLLTQLARICESQASLASHFDAHLGKSLEIASQESAELCDLTQRTFSEILDKAVLKAKVYKQE